jgi:hypothetical protein
MYFEAERSFRQAATIDPDCAMAYWGMTMANVKKCQACQGVPRRGLEARRPADPPRNALPRCSGSPLQDGVDPKARKQNHLLGLETFVQVFPEDLDARAWMALVTWQNGTIGSLQAVDVVLDTVL